jgi:hypothetical protein
MKTETIVKWFVLFIILVKTAYSIAYYGHLIILNTSKTLADKFDKQFNDRLFYWKSVTEFIFVVCMSILLIYHFYPENGLVIQKPIIVDKETRLLFLTYGIILIFTANWTVLFDKDSYIIQIIDKLK